jgi:hypothetical protein
MKLTNIWEYGMPYGMFKEFQLWNKQYNGQKDGIYSWKLVYYWKGSISNH